jgi:hypothetical protein
VFQRLEDRARSFTSRRVPDVQGEYLGTAGTGRRAALRSGPGNDATPGRFAANDQDWTSDL